MTRKEALEKINELEEYIEKLDATVGDEIFLLSVEEYEKYRYDIPQFNAWWWLRSKGSSSDIVESVCCGNIKDSYSTFIDGCVRPALRLKSNAHPIGSRLMKYDFPWIVIDSNLAIAEVPIATHRFDEKSNNYEASEIRRFLLDWIEIRK